MKEHALKIFANLRSQPGMDEPLVRWGLLGIAVICFWILIFSPYLDWRDLRQSAIGIQSNKAVKTLALKAVSETWKKSSEQHRKMVKILTEALFQGSSYASSQAALLNRMVGLLQEHHLTLDSQRLLDAEHEQGLGQRVAIFLRAEGSQVDVLSFIDAVARDDKLIVLDKLYLNRGGNALMMLQFQATGFRLTGDRS